MSLYCSFTIDLKSDNSGHKTHQQGLLSIQLMRQASKNWMSGVQSLTIVWGQYTNAGIWTYLWDFGNISLHKIYPELKYTLNALQQGLANRFVLTLFQFSFQ